MFIVKSQILDSTVSSRTSLPPEIPASNGDDERERPDDADGSSSAGFLDGTNSGFDHLGQDAGTIMYSQGNEEQLQESGMRGYGLPFWSFFSGSNEYPVMHVQTPTLQNEFSVQF